jgi:AraC family transcriptional regulator
MARHLSESTKSIEAEASFAFGRAQIIRRVWDEPIDVIGASNEHRLEFAMLPRSNVARGSFPDCRGADQFGRFGEVFFIPAGRVVHAKSYCRQQFSVVCSFRPEAVEFWFYGGLQWTHARLQAGLNITNPTIRSLLVRLGEEVGNPGFAGAAMIEMMAGQVGIELARYLTGIEELPHTGGLSPRNLRRIDERLAQDGAPPSLTDLADLCGLSVRHLTRAFRTSRRRSIGDYIAECRMQRAKHLLAEGMSVKWIAYTMGFSSPAALSSAFRRATGERPRDYAGRSASTAVMSGATALPSRRSRIHSMQAAPPANVSTVIVNKAGV